jgi:hypothetical protein
MLEKLVKFLREYVLVFSGILIIFGLFFLLMGVFWILFNDLVNNTSFLFHFVVTFKEWNWYFLIFGLIMLGIGLYYVYSFVKKRRFVIKEIKTDKRSEILKKRREIESAAKHLPTKYQNMLAEKEEELNIK